MNAKLFCFFQVGLSTSEAKVRDLFEHKDLGIYKQSFMAKVNPSGVIMVKLTPIHYELWFRQCLVRKQFGERSEPSHFFSPDHSRYTPLARGHTRLAPLTGFFFTICSPRPLSAHCTRPSPRPHLARSSRGFLFYAWLTSLTEFFLRSPVFTGYAWCFYIKML